MQSVEGRSIILTGGGSGIGAGTAHYLAERGVRVTIAGRRADRLDEVAAQVPGSIRAQPCDVTRGSDREALVEAALEHGGGRIDGLVHGAGNMYRGAIEDLEEEALLEVFHSNVVGPMMLTGRVVPYLEASSGAVIVFGSVHTARAFPGASPYAATKGALETLTGVLAAELGPRGIRVSAVRPGAVFTEINQRAGLFDDETAKERLESLAPAHALGRIGTVQEIAEAIAYLLVAEWTTGNVLVVDGGLGLGVTHA